MPKRDKRSAEKKNIMQQLDSIGARLAAAQYEFNSTSEPELIEASVYEINSLNSRYAYLLRRAKELDITHIPPQRRYPQ
ncbi:MAG: DUF2508 family protein [Oscillospiraceae bacterium]|nr:DUF2508 family protein [Oscillospiraceae bacterium]